jgi:hypothetical protein
VRSSFSGVSGLLDGLQNQNEQEGGHQGAASLAPVLEESDDDGSGQRSGTTSGFRTRNGPSPTGSDRRTSGSSVASTEASSSSLPDSTRSSLTSLGSHEQARTTARDGQRTPTLGSDAGSSFADEETKATTTTTKHARRRSTLDVVGNWSAGLGKRLQDMRESDTCVASSSTLV